MKQARWMMRAVLVAILLQGLAASAAFAQAAADEDQAATGYLGEDQQAAGPAGAPRPLDIPVLYVTGIDVQRSTLAPPVYEIRVTGLVSSRGWSSPQLVPFFYGKPADGVLDLQLIATSPNESQKAEGFVPISASFTLEAGQPYKGVRVRAGANALELDQLPGSVRTQIKANDCAQCIGKKFVEKGTSQQGTDIVREEDLPRGFRVILPTHGVAGITHNPNRIDLILDANHTIVMAFWE
jgi:hypothetical protein